MWALKVFSPHTMANLAGVPKTYSMTGDDARFVTEIIDSMFPVPPSTLSTEAWRQLVDQPAGGWSCSTSSSSDE